MKRFKHLLITLALIFASIGCEKKGITSIKFYNNSNYSVDVYVALGAKYGGTAYPDTILPLSDLHLYRYVKPNSFSYVISSLHTYEELYSDLPKDTLSIFVLHSDTVKKYEWSKIRKDNMYLKRYDLNIKDVKEHHDFYYP